MRRLLPAILLLAPVFAGCGGKAKGVPGSPEQVLAGAAARSGVKGIPPLGFYRWGEDGYVAIPVLGIVHRKDFSLGLFGILHMGTTRVDRDPDGRATRVRMRDFNLLGFYNASERQFLEGDKLVRERSRRLFWILPLGTTREEIPALAAGGIRGAVPLWFYWNKFPWHVTTPLLLAHHSDRTNVGFLGLANLGLRSVETDDKGAPREVRLLDVNLLGLWSTSERIYREGEHVFHQRTNRILWLFAF